MYPVIRAAWFAAVLVLILPVVGRAQPVRVALSGVTPAPGTGTFTSFDRFPSVSGGVVGFRGLYGGGQGIYTGIDGTPVLIANSATTVPATGLTFGSAFGSPTVSGPTVVFTGGPPAGPPFPFRGVYAAPTVGGTITGVADNTTTNPGPPSGPFTSFTEMLGVSGTTVAFSGGSAFRGGIYTIPVAGPPTATAIAQTGDTIPVLGGPFVNFSFASVSGSRVAFDGFGPAGGGVFTAATSGGALTAVATTATPIPGGVGNFGAFGDPVVSGSVVAFTGGPGGIPPAGIYSNTGPGGSLVAIANTSTPIPNSTGNFANFKPQVSLFGDDVVFIGNHASGAPGLYTNATGPLTRLITVGQTLDGRTVADLDIGRQSFDGTSVTFWAGFADGSSGIYVIPVAPVPEPAGLLAVGVAAGGLLRLARRRLA